MKTRLGSFHNHGTQTMDDSRICVCHHNIILWPNEPSIVSWIHGLYKMACLYYNKQGNNVCHHNTSKMIYHRAWGGGGGG